jgi:hypothetical protein
MEQQMPRASSVKIDFLEWVHADLQDVPEVDRRRRQQRPVRVKRRRRTGRRSAKTVPRLKCRMSECQNVKRKKALALWLRNRYELNMLMVLCNWAWNCTLIFQFLNACMQNYNVVIHMLITRDREKRYTSEIRRDTFQQEIYKNIYIHIHKRKKREK